MIKSVETKIAEFFEQDVLKFATFLTELDRRIDSDAIPRKDKVLAQLSEAYDAMHLACSSLEQEILPDEELLQVTQARYREAIAPWMDRSWMMFNSREKPRGYPGDFEMLEYIYNGRPVSRGLGGYLCLHACNTTLAKGVIARMQNARDFLIHEVTERAGDKRIHIMNVACGPCRELFESELRFLKDHDVCITLIDQEKDALDFVQEKVQTLGANNFPTIRVFQHNALRMRSAERNIARFDAADVLYSVGLCDYLPDRILIPMLQGWRQTLKPGGAMYVAFKDQLKYDKTSYQWTTDWHFLQRTTEECRDLYLKAGFHDGEITMTRDSVTESIITFCGRIPEAPTARSIRIDPQHVEASKVNSLTQSQI